MSKLSLPPEKEYGVIKERLNKFFETLRNSEVSPPQQLLIDLKETALIVASLLGEDTNDSEVLEKSVGLCQSVLYCLSMSTEERLEFYQSAYTEISKQITENSDGGNDNSD